MRSAGNVGHLARVARRARGNAHARRPARRIIGEQALVRLDLDLRHQGANGRRQVRRRLLRVERHLGRERRRRHGVLHAGEMRRAIAGDDAVVDHLEVGRRHGDDDRVDGRRRDAAGDDVLERLRRRHGLPRRAPRLEGDLS